MNYINKIFTGVILMALIFCGMGTFLPFHSRIHLMDWKLYNFLFLIVLANFLFVFLKKHLMTYKIISLVLSVFMALSDSTMNYLYRVNILPLIISGIFTIAFIILLLAKERANWDIVFLVNCLFIFIFINWLGLTYINPFSSSYLTSLSGIIIKNINELFVLRDIGYFISNIGVIVAIVFGLLRLILNRINIKAV